MGESGLFQRRLSSDRLIAATEGLSQNYVKQLVDEHPVWKTGGGRRLYGLVQPARRSE